MRVCFCGVCRASHLSSSSSSFFLFFFSLFFFHARLNRNPKYDEDAITPRPGGGASPRNVGGNASGGIRGTGSKSPRAEIPATKVKEDKPRQEAAELPAAKAKSEPVETGGPLRVGSIVKAKFKYAATRDDELSFKKNDLIEIVALDPKAKWHSGRLASNSGKGEALKFPANYI